MGRGVYFWSGGLLLLAASRFYFFGASSREGGRPQERGSGAGRRRTTSVERILLLLGRANKSGAEHRRIEGEHRRNYFFSGVNGYYFCVGVVLVDGG